MDNNRLKESGLSVDLRGSQTVLVWSLNDFETLANVRIH